MNAIEKLQLLPQYYFCMRYVDSACDDSIGFIRVLKYKKKFYCSEASEWEESFPYVISSSSHAGNNERFCSAYSTNQNLAVFFGPICSYAVGTLSRYNSYLWRVPIVTVGGFAYTFMTRHRTTSPANRLYDLLTLAGYNYSQVGAMLLQLFRELSWRRLFVLYSGIDFPRYYDQRYCSLIKTAIGEVYEDQVKSQKTNKDSFYMESEYFMPQRETETIEAVLKNKIGRSFSVVVLCAASDSVRKIMLAAYDLNFINGEYVFFDVDLFNSKDNLTRPWYRSWDTHENNEKAKKAYRALMTVTVRRTETPAFEEFSTEVKRLAKEHYNYDYGNNEVSTLVGAYHDAILLYALALNDTLRDGYKINDGLQITKRMRNRTFEGITGSVTIDGNGDRCADYSLLDMNPNTGDFRVVGNYFGKDKQFQFLDGTSIDWATRDNQPPADVPTCGFDNSGCQSGSFLAIWIVIALSLFSFTFGVSSFLLYRHAKLRAELLSMDWLISWEDISILRDFPLADVVELSPSESPYFPHFSTQTENNIDEKVGSSPLPVRFRAPTAPALSKHLNIPRTEILHTSPSSLDPADLTGLHSFPLKVRRLSEAAEAASPLHRPRNITQRCSTSRESLSQNIRIRQPRNGGVLNQRKTVNRRETHDASRTPITQGEDGAQFPTEKRKVRSRSKQLKDLWQRKAKDNHKALYSNIQEEIGDALEDRDSDLSYHSGDDISDINGADGGRSQFAPCGTYRGSIVALKRLHLTRAQIELTKQQLMEFKKIKDLNHSHVARFIGICLDSPYEYLLTEYCNKGSLEDLLGDEEMKLDWMFKYAIIQDVCLGMLYLHNNLGPHGRLKSSNCLIDSRFAVKITDYGIPHYRAFTESRLRPKLEDELWISPEHLRNTANSTSSVKGDVYSFGILVHAMIYRRGTFYRTDINSVPDIIDRVKVVESPHFRPHLLDDEPCPTQFKQLIHLLWAEDPAQRPDFNHIKVALRRIDPKSSSVEFVDNLLSRMQQYANNLEDLVEQRTYQLNEEKKRSEELLYSMLPRSVAEQLINGNAVEAESYEAVTIYFSDICEFTSLSAQSTPMEIVNLLNDLYTLFDSILENYDAYKVETIGDAYMVVSGLPQRNGNLHAREIARMSLAFLSSIFRFKIAHRPDMQLRIRIGLHSGAVCAGVVGRKMPRYALFGDSVNTASRLESNGEALRIHISEATRRILLELGNFCIVERGNVELKGKGQMKTYWLLGEGDELVDTSHFGTSEMTF